MTKTTKRNVFQLSAIAAAMALSATGSFAAGLGKITVLSALGQPLHAEIDVSAAREELVSMSARLASPEAFKQVGIEYAPGVSGIRFLVDKRKDGQTFLRVTSDRAINEPFLDVLVELTWSSGRMVREYTLLLDPPEAISKAVPAPVATPEAAKQAAAGAAPATTAAPAAAQAAPAAPAAPAAKPVAKPAAAAVPAPSAAKDGEDAGTRLVKSGDTLSKIATATKPEGVSLDQMLVALFRGNPEAFEGGNMNRLRAGKILNVPGADAASAVASVEARQIIVAQARDFNAYRGKLAASVAATPAKQDSAKQQDQGKIAPKVADKAATPEPAKDKLEVSRTELAKDNKAIQGRITALEEDLVARDRALKEANSRVGELERNLSDLKKLAEMKSQSAAQLQQQAQAAKPAAADVKPPPPEPVVVKPVEPLPAPVEPPKAAEVPVPPPPVAEPPKPAEPAVAAEAPKPDVAPPAPPPVQEESSFIDENPALIYGGGGLLAVVLGYLGFSAWRRKSASGDRGTSTASRLSEGDLMANSVFGTTGGQAVDTSASIQTDFSQASLSAIDTDEGVDPVAEADVYMAYGRDAQAEEILVDALKTDPTRLAIYLKLLEIHSGHKNIQQFGKVASDLHAQTGGTGPEWDKAVIMGRAIDPSNLLYAGAALQTEQEPEPLMPEAAPAPLAVESPIAFEKMDDTVALPGQLAQLAAAAEPIVAPANLGFDLDLGAEPVTGFTALDSNLDLGTPAKGPVHVEPLDIDLSLPEIQPAVAPSAFAAESGSGGLDFEFDLDAPPASSSVAAPSASAIDFSGINLDLVTASPAFEEVKEMPEVASAGVDDSDVATKLELAQAYEEMGDREGARELLQEVAQEGSSQQQELARTRLAALDA